MTHPPIEEVRGVMDEVIEEIQHGNLVTDHQVRPLLKAAEAYCEMQWRPIEEFKGEDGEWVQLYWYGMPINMYPAIGYYEDGLYANPKSWSLVSHPEYGEVFPTHWMPLPNPPQENQDEK